jgi:hypothetical protein
MKEPRAFLFIVKLIDPLWNRNLKHIVLGGKQIEKQVLRRK